MTMTTTTEDGKHWELGEKREVDGVWYTAIRVISTVGFDAGVDRDARIREVARRLGCTKAEHVSSLCHLCAYVGRLGKIEHCGYVCGQANNQRIVRSDAVPLLALEGVLE